MTAPPLDYIAFDKPRYLSNQVSRKEDGSPYFYEEYEDLNVNWVDGATPSSAPSRMILVRNGRVVTMLMTGQAFGVNGSARFIDSLGSVIPERFRPVKGSDSAITFFACNATQGTVSGAQGPGQLSVNGDGTLRIGQALSKALNDPSDFDTFPAGKGSGFSNIYVTWFVGGVTNVKRSYIVQ